MSNQTSESSSKAQKPDWKEGLRRQNQRLLLFASLALVFASFVGGVALWKAYVYHNVTSGIDVIHGLTHPVNEAKVDVVPLKSTSSRPSSLTELNQMPNSSLPPAEVRDVLKIFSKSKPVFVGSHNHPHTLSAGMIVVELGDGKLYFMRFTILQEDGKPKYVLISSGPEGSLSDWHFKNYESDDPQLIATLEQAMLGAKQQTGL